MFLERRQSTFHIHAIVVEVWGDADISIATGGDDLLSFKDRHVCILICGCDCEHGTVQVGRSRGNDPAAHRLDASA